MTHMDLLHSGRNLLSACRSLRRLMRPSMPSARLWRRRSRDCRERWRTSWLTWKELMLKQPAWIKNRRVSIRLSDNFMHWYGKLSCRRHPHTLNLMSFIYVTLSFHTEHEFTSSLDPLWVEAEIWGESSWAGWVAERGSISQHWALQNKELLRGGCGTPGDNQTGE